MNEEQKAPTPASVNIDPDILKHARKLRENYVTNSAGKPKRLNALIMGHKGVGKTTLATTCPKPVIIDSFDPNGTVTRALQPYIEKGDILVNDFEHDRWLKPKVFEKWVAHFEKLVSMNFFDHVGTYFFDSLSFFSKYMAYRIVQMNENNRQSQHTLSQQGFRVMLWRMLDVIEQVNNLPCHTIVTGHVSLMSDEITGEMHTSLLLPGKQSVEIPNAFMEQYICKIKPGGKDHILQVKGDGKWHAESRLGGDKFNAEEPPDIKKLLIKAGVPANDKPSLLQ